MNFEDAVAKVMRDNPHASRGDVLDALHEAYISGDPQVTTIPDIQSRLRRERLAAQPAGFARGFEQPFVGIANKIAPYVGMKNLMEGVVDPATSWSEYESAPVAEFAGGMAGLGQLTEGISAPLGVVPGLRTIMASERLPVEMIRGALEGNVLSRTGALGDMSPEAATIQGALAPPVFRGAGKLVGKAAEATGIPEWLAARRARLQTGDEFTRAAPEGPTPGMDNPPPTPTGPIEAPPSLYETLRSGAERERATRAQVMGQPAFSQTPPGPAGPVQYPLEVPQGGPFDEMFRGRAPFAPREGAEAPVSVFEKGRSRKSGSLPSQADIVAEKLRTMEPTGLTGVRQGTPFHTEFMTRVPGPRPNTFEYVDPRSPLSARGSVAVGDFKNPLVVEVGQTGVEGWRDAARTLYANQPGALGALEDSEDPEGLAHELVARWAKQRGHDSVALSTPDLTSNSILDISNFKSSKHPEIRADVVRPSKQLPKASPFTIETRGAGAPQPERGPLAPASPAAPTPEQRTGLDVLKGAGREQAAQKQKALGLLYRERALLRKQPESPERAMKLSVIESHIAEQRGGAGALSEIDKAEAPISHASFRPKGGPDPVAGAVQGTDNPASLVDPQVEPLPDALDAAFGPLKKSMDAAAKSDVAAEPYIQGSLAKDALVTGQVDTFDPEQHALAVHLDHTSGAFTRLKPPAYMSNHPRVQEFFQRLYPVIDRYRYRVPAQIGKGFKRFLKDYGHFQTSDWDEVARAVHGYEYNDKGELIQNALGVDSKHDPAARHLVSVRDRLYSMLTGNDPRVPSIWRRFGLSHERPVFERVRAIQVLGEDEFNKHNPKRPATITESAAAAAAKGMLRFDDTHDLDIDPFGEFMNIHPVENELGMLKDDIKHLQRLRAAGGLTDEQMSVTEKQLTEEIARIKRLIGQQAPPKMPGTDFLPRKKWVSWLKLKDVPGARPYFVDHNPRNIVGQWVNAATNKRIADVVLADVRSMLRDGSIPNATKERLTEFANIMRGSTGFRGDAKFADWWNSSPLGRMKKVTPTDIHSYTTNIMGWQGITKLFLSPVRFPIINLTHPLVTLYPVVGEKAFAKGLARVLANPKQTFLEAMAEGLIGKDSQWFREIGQIEPTNPAYRGLRVLSHWTENFRIVLSREAALAAAADKNFNPAVRGFVEKGPWQNDLQKSRAYARAVVGTTQFRFGPEGKPMALTGSPIRRVVGQFKTWPTSLGALYAEMYKQGQWQSLARGFVAMAFLGGPAALVGGPGVYDLIRHEALTHGVNLPDKTGYQFLSEAFGLQGTPADMIEMFSLKDPFGVSSVSPTGLAGPAVGSFIDAATNAYRGAMENKSELLVRPAMQAAFGQAVPMAQTAAEMIRGGVYGPGGDLEVHRDLLAQVVRGLDLTPSVRSVRYKYMRDIADATYGGNTATVKQLVDEARSKGIVLGPKFFSAVKAMVGRMRRNSKGNVWEKVL